MTSQLGASQLGVSQLGSGTTDGGNPLNQTVNQSLGLVGTATYIPIINVLASNRLGLNAGQTVTSQFVVVATGNVLGLVASTGYHQEISIIQYLGFTSRVFANAANVLGLENAQRVNEAVIVSAQNNMLTGGGKALRIEVASNNLGLTNVAFPNNLQSASNQLNFTEVVDLDDQAYAFGVTQSMFKQHVSYTIRNSRDSQDLKYAPLIGSSDNTDFPELPTVGPTLSTGILTLTHPFVSPTLTLILRNPDFGNTDVINFTRIDRDTRGGDRKIFSDPKWAQWERLTLPITNICTVTDGNIIAFLNASLGEKIGLLDWEGRQWKGIIVNPETDVVELSGGFSVRLVFEGEIVP